MPREKKFATEQTYDRWKREYGGLRTDRAKRLKDLEKENARLTTAEQDAFRRDLLRQRKRTD